MSYKCNSPYSLQLRDGEWKCCKMGLGCVDPQQAPTLLDEMPGPGYAAVTGDDSVHSAATNEIAEACKKGACELGKNTVREAVSAAGSVTGSRPDLESQAHASTNELEAAGVRGGDVTTQRIRNAAR